MSRNTGLCTLCRAVGASIVLVMLAALAALPASGWAAPPDDSDIVVHVTKDGPTISADVDCPVKAPVAVVWDVLVDYDHMVQFISNLETSVVRKRDGDGLIVYQKGKAKRGPLAFAFENEREINLVPYREIRSRLISGDLKTSEFTTRIVDEGGVLHIVNSGRYTPKIWVPPLIGPAIIEAETRKQFGEIRTEILRRSRDYSRARVPSSKRGDDCWDCPLQTAYPAAGRIAPATPNSRPACDPRFASRCTISSPHFGHTGAGATTSRPN